MQTNGHWADVGGTVPGSFDITAKEHYGEGLRIPPVKIWDKGEYRADVARLLVSNMRLSEERLGDLRAQAEATRIGEEYLRRLIAKYGVDTVVAAMAECQNYVERLTRAQIAELPKGTWETDDFLDIDPDKGEGLVRIHVKLTIEGDDLHYDLYGLRSRRRVLPQRLVRLGVLGHSRRAPRRSSRMRRSTPASTASSRRICRGERRQRALALRSTGFCSGAYEKIMNATFELWSKVLQTRARLLVQPGIPPRRRLGPPAGYDRQFMWYDWMVGGWGGRNGKDGSTATAPVFGVGLMIQPLEGQERLTPVVTTHHAILRDSGGPGNTEAAAGWSRAASSPRTSDL